MIEVNYNGSYPNLCSGKWFIRVSGVTINTDGFKEMNTYGYLF